MTGQHTKTSSSQPALADMIAPHLPYLRRYGRALCGTQESGDNFVVATLEAIIADNALFNVALEPRQALYHAFHRIWSATPTNSRTEPADAEASTRRIAQLTPLPRQAFLLTALEEFDLEGVAAVLGTDRTTAGRLVDEAGREVARQIAARVLIIEDEPMIAMDIDEIIREIGHTCVGIAATRSEAVAMARSSKPDIILSDIQLADGSSGIDAVADILSERAVPVVFITAYPERLLTGERAEPTFLVTKPFQPSMVKAIVSQALFFDQSPRS